MRLAARWQTAAHAIGQPRHLAALVSADRCRNAAVPGNQRLLVPSGARTLRPWLGASVTSIQRCSASSGLASAPQADAALQSADVSTPAVVLEVGGMKCGGCSAAVKRMLSTRPDVESAAVNLLTETAAVKFRGDPSMLGPEAAAMLSAKGFPSKVRVTEDSSPLGDNEIAARAAARQKEAARARTALMTAWGLAAVSAVHHAGHVLHLLGQHELAHSPFFVLLGNPWLSGALGAAALLGPGREMLTEGFRSLAAGTPNMNSLVAMGCTTSFLVGAISALNPAAGLGFDASFLEEPVMLLAFVLLGRALEAQAKVQAASDLTALASLIPATSRLVLDAGLAPAAAKAGASAPAPECIQVPTATVRPGDVLRVLPGEKVPVDGVVVSGRGAADEAMLTGESRLVNKDVGSVVTGGTVAYEGVLDIRATNTGASSTLAGLARLVTEAQSKEAPVQRLADSVAGRFCYGVMGAAALTFGFWWLVGTQIFPQVLEVTPFAESMSDWTAMTSAMHSGGAWGGAYDDPTAPTPLLLAVKLAVDVLVVACPCALGLATPTAALVASSMGAKRGLLLRGGGEVLERLAGVRAVAFDKTGTVTQGKLRVTNIQLADTARANGHTPESLLAVTAALEASTRHPLAEAVLTEAKARDLALPAIDEPTHTQQTHTSTNTTNNTNGSVASTSGNSSTNGSGSTTGRGVAGVVTEPGAGIHAAIGGVRWWVGKRSWVAEKAGVVGGGGGAGVCEEVGSTPIYVGCEGQGVVGVISARDTIRADAAAVVSALHAKGISVHMLSGDSQATVNAIAHSAGIDTRNAHGDMTPQDKLCAIKKLREQYGSVAMVGDGVNDAPALAAADVGIAMQGGLDAAGEAARVVLMGDRLSQTVEALDLGRATLNKIRSNLAWALGYNAIGIPLAAGVLLPSQGLALNPSIAAGMMALSSVAVVSNSLLLRTLRFPTLTLTTQRTDSAAGTQGGSASDSDTAGASAQGAATAR